VALLSIAIAPATAGGGGRWRGDGGQVSTGGESLVLVTN
jgi:hypothetical protein